MIFLFQDVLVFPWLLFLVEWTCEILYLFWQLNVYVILLQICKQDQILS